MNSQNTAKGEFGKIARSLISDNKFEDVIAIIKAEVEDNLKANLILVNEVIGISSRYNRLNENKIKGTISQEYETIEQNQIVAILLVLINKIESELELQNTRVSKENNDISKEKSNFGNKVKVGNFKEMIQQERGSTKPSYQILVPKRVTEPPMIFVEGRSFYIGSPQKYDEGSKYFTNVGDFMLGEAPVTVEEYFVYCDDTKTPLPNEPSWEWKGKENHPIVNVSWRNANNYCEWLSKKTNKNFRLPTEAEWEYAAADGYMGYNNSGKRNKRWAGTSELEKLIQYAWFKENSNGETHPIKQKKSNGLGLFDMCGNVWEWCQNTYENYPPNIQTEEKKLLDHSKNHERVIRGGGPTGNELTLGVDFRSKFLEHLSTPFIGFRLALTLS